MSSGPPSENSLTSLSAAAKKAIADVIPDAVTAEMVEEAKRVLHEEVRQWKTAYAMQAQNPEEAERALDWLERKGIDYFDTQLSGTAGETRQILVYVKKQNDFPDAVGEAEQRKEEIAATLKKFADYLSKQENDKPDKPGPYGIPRTAIGRRLFVGLMDPAISGVLKRLREREKAVVRDVPSTLLNETTSTKPEIKGEIIKPPAATYYSAEAVDDALRKLAFTADSWKQKMPGLSARETQLIDTLTEEARSFLESADEKTMLELYPAIRTFSAANREIANRKLDVRGMLAKSAEHGRGFEKDRKKAATDHQNRHDLLLAALLEEALRILDRTALRESGIRIS